MATTVLFALAFSVYAETLSIPANSSTYTSTKNSSAPGSQYYAKTVSASYTGMPSGYVPSDGTFTFTLYTSGGLVAGQSKTAGIGVPVYPSVNTFYQTHSGDYKLLVRNNAASNGTTANVAWNP